MSSGPNTFRFPERFHITDVKTPFGGLGITKTMLKAKKKGNIIRNSVDVENHTRRIPGKLKLVFDKQNKVSKITLSANGKSSVQETTPATTPFHTLPAVKFSPTAGPRSFSNSARNYEVVQADPITISSTPGTYRIIQPINIVSTTSPRVQSHTFNSISSTSKFLSTTARPTSQSWPEQFPIKGPIQRFPKKQSPSLKFAKSGSSVLSQQVLNNPLTGFPNGLPKLTPLGVRLSLENILGNQRLDNSLAMRQFQDQLMSWWVTPSLERPGQTTRYIHLCLIQTSSAHNKSSLGYIQTHRLGVR